MTTGARRRALVVEDEATVAMLLEDMLVDLGHEVVAIASKFETAAELVARGDFDFAVLDVNLNGRHSYDLARALKDCGIPFLFVTGYGPAGLRADWKDASVLQKPFRLQQLRDMIAALKPCA